MKRLVGAQAKWLRWPGIPLLVLLATLALTFAYWQRERREDDALRRAAFDRALHDTSQRIEQRMAAHQHLLQGVQGFLAAYPQADEQALRRYVDALPLGADFAGLQGIAIAPRTAAVDRLPAAGAGARTEVAAIVQIEPAVPRNRAALGLDLLAHPIARKALEQARDSGRMALSARLELRQLHLGAQPGFLLVVPIYAGGDMPDQPALRRERLRAWAIAPVAVPELMASLYGEQPAGLALALYDGQELADANLLYRDLRAQSAGIERRGHEFLVMGGHTWTLALETSPLFAARQGADEPRQVLWAGGTLSVLLALLAWLLGTARERAQSLAERMTQALRESEQRWSFALEGAGDGVWDWRLADGTLHCSMRWKTIMGLRPGSSELDMARARARIHPEDLPRVDAELQRCLDGLTPSLTSEYRVAGAHGGWTWVLSRGTVIERDREQKPLRLIGTLSDINVRRMSEERVRFMALHDPLTELANRAHFEERLHFALANARRYNETIGLILLDLDRFKPVNDQYGHGVGDQLLQTVAKRIKGSVRETDTVGRIGGDEFVVLLTGPVTRETAQIVCDKIFNQVALPLELAGVRLEITCSLGLALYPDDGHDELSLTKAADDSMYRNKRAGRQLFGEARSAPPEH